MPSVIAPCHDAVGLSAHARRRAQQRAIPLGLLELLLDHGARVPARAGAEIVHFTPATRQECAAEMHGSCATKLRSAYAVVSAEGVVITVGHRFRRVGRR